MPWLQMGVVVVSVLGVGFLGLVRARAVSLYGGQLVVVGSIGLTMGEDGACLAGECYAGGSGGGIQNRTGAPGGARIQGGAKGNNARRARPV